MAGSVIGSVAGNVASGIIGGIGNKKAERQFQSGANAAQQIFTPQPFRAGNRFGQVDNRGQFTFNPIGNKRLQQILQISNKRFNTSEQFHQNRDAFAEKLLRAADRVNDKRESQAFSSLESKLFNRAGASTGTQRQIADFQSDIEDRRFQRAVNAEQIADQRNRALLGDFLGVFNNATQYGRQGEDVQRLSLLGAQALRPFAINDPAQANAGAFRAQNTQSFFDGLGGVIGGGLDAGISLLGGGGSGVGGGINGGGFFNPNAINFGSNPFTSFG